MSKSQFKALVKSNVRNATFHYLISLKQTHSKMAGLAYKKCQVQEYLISLLFRLRTRTVNGIKNDFIGLYSDITCPLGCGDTDTIQNILTCRALISQHKTSEISRSNIKHEDIYSDDVQKKQVTELYRQLLQLRNEITSQPVANTGPMHSSNTLQSLSSNLIYGGKK